MKTVLTAVISLALAFVASACNFASLSEPPKMSETEMRARNKGRIQGRINQGAFRPLSSAPNRPHGG